MRLRMLVIGGLLGWCAVAVAQAPSPFAGTWKLNLAKSKYDPGPPPKSVTQTNEAVEGGVKQVSETVDAEGKAARSEWTAKFDGKDYPVTGNPVANAIWLKRADHQTIDWGLKKDGKVVASGRTVYSRDGKTRTMTWTGTNAKGQKTSNTSVYEKQ